VEYFWVQVFSPFSSYTPINFFTTSRSFYNRILNISFYFLKSSL